MDRPSMRDSWVRLLAEWGKGGGDSSDQKIIGGKSPPVDRGAAAVKCIQTTRKMMASQIGVPTAFDRELQKSEKKDGFQEALNPTLYYHGWRENGSIQLCSIIPSQTHNCETAIIPTPRWSQLNSIKSRDPIPIIMSEGNITAIIKPQQTTDAISINLWSWLPVLPTRNDAQHPQNSPEYFRTHVF